jgi:hypothetical protein
MLAAVATIETGFDTVNLTPDSAMTEPMPTTQTPSEPLAYQPISGWAIAGFTIGSLFSLLVVICAIVGVVQGAPVFFPVWVMAFAIVGLALSILGQRHVQNSEGTRAGAKLARAGLWLSLVSGLTYFSYYAVTGMALQSQADAFLREKGDEYSGFFPRLREGGDNPVQLNNAFLLTQPPSSRSGRPDDEISMRKSHDIPTKEGASGLLTQFRHSVFARAFSKHLGKDVEITPLAVQDWRYEQRSYKVFRIYHVKTKEVEMDFMLAVCSAEAESPGQIRRWFIDLKESYAISATKKLTPIGEGMRELRKQASDWLGARGQVKEGEPSLGDIGPADKTDWTRLLLPDGKEDEIKMLVHQSLTPDNSVRGQKFQILTRPDDVGRWEQLDGKVRVELVFAFDIPGAPGRPPLRVEGAAMLETMSAIEPGQFNADTPQPNWNLARVVFTTVRQVHAPPTKQ